MKYIKSVSIISIIIVIAAVFVSCEKEDSSVIDPILTFPKILGTSITPSTYDTSDVNGIAWARVTSEEQIQKVTVTVKNPQGTQVDVFELKDDGSAPDTAAGDGNYTGRITFSMSCRIVGTYQGSFLGQNVSGLTSGVINVPFSVINSNNHSPVISNLIIVPDSVHVNTATFIIFEVTAIDPDGSCDIKEVYYDGFKPDNSPLERRILYDDGSCCLIENTGVTSGDSTANDNRFTRRLYGPPDQVGYYRYYLHARDNSDSLSNVLSDSIYVYP